MQSQELPADPVSLFETAEAVAKAAAARHTQMRADEAGLRAAIAWARFAYKSNLAVSEGAATSVTALRLVKLARQHQLRAERQLRRRLAAFIGSQSRIRQL